MVCWLAGGGHRAILKPRVTVVDTGEGRHAAHRMDVELREVRGSEEVVVLYLDPPRPTAEVLNGAAEFNPGFSITENKQHACVFRLVFQYVHSASGEVVRTHR